ncbi:hypothetical protein CBI30_10770 [Polynucleobacter aenigmaticus]|uniref:Uncharacterized protein n=1 Tax=Polynucleobacter aenigmaticus TaxID=1743164 RepID=A0A254PRQ6_9BURK|nr:hypothetical protein CBI30_10770 [Polynucleobacter aenigmaticus]
MNELLFNKWRDQLDWLIKKIIPKYTLTSSAKGIMKHAPLFFWFNGICCYLFGTINGLLDASSRDVRRRMTNLTISVSKHDT